MFCRVCISVGGEVLTRAVRSRRRGLPSRHSLTRRCKMDHIAVQRSLTRLRGSNVVVQREKHNSFIGRAPHPVLRRLGLPSSGVVRSTQDFISPRPRVIRLAEFRRASPRVNRGLGCSNPVFCVGQVFQIGNGPVTIGHV